MSPLERLADPTGAAIAAMPPQQAARALVAAWRAARDEWEREARRGREQAEQLAQAVERWADTGALPEQYADIDIRCAELGEPCPDCGLNDLDEWVFGVLWDAAVQVRGADSTGEPCSFNAVERLKELRAAVGESTVASSTLEKLDAALERTLYRAVRLGRPAA